MTQSIDIKGILEALPHRYPFILVDKVLDYTPFETLNAIKNVTINEPFFQGHFPGNPVMPGVLMLESLAQAGGLLSTLSRTPSPGHSFIYYFASIDNAKFKAMVVPGDQLTLNIQVTMKRKDFWKVHGQAFVGDTLACSADLMSASKEVKRD